MFVLSFKILGRVFTEKSLTENFKKILLEQMRKKKTKKDFEAICGWFLNTEYNLQYLMFLPNFKILSQVLDGKQVYRQINRQTNRQKTNILMEKAKTICPIDIPLYTLYTMGINIINHKYAKRSDFKFFFLTQMISLVFNINNI